MAEEYPVKITFGEMREAGYSGILIYCRDFKCSHNVRMNADRWPDHVRISDVEPSFTCTACGRKGGEIRSDPQTFVRPDRYRP